MNVKGASLKDLNLRMTLRKTSYCPAGLCFVIRHIIFIGFGLSVLMSIQHKTEYTRANGHTRERKPI